MPISKCFTFAGTALLVLLFACHAHFYQAYFHEGMDRASSGSASAVSQGPATDERRLADDVTPAVRVRETFAVFVPGDVKRMRDMARLLARAVKPQA
jgi:hypothetical protein